MTECHFAVLNKEDYKKILLEREEAQIRRNLLFLMEIPVLRELVIKVTL
jgi:hypothetical protein